MFILISVSIVLYIVPVRERHLVSNGLTNSKQENFVATILPSRTEKLELKYKLSLWTSIIIRVCNKQPVYCFMK